MLKVQIARINKPRRYQVAASQAEHQQQQYLISALVDLSSCVLTWSGGSCSTLLHMLLLLLLCWLWLLLLGMLLQLAVAHIGAVTAALTAVPLASGNHLCICCCTFALCRYYYLSKVEGGGGPK
jgi:Cu/Ag efflux pump CusA